MITACSGGGKGTSGSKGGGGGDGGDWIFREPYTVTPGQNIKITVGKGATSAGTAGGATVISPLVTLSCPGIRGGKGGNKNTNIHGQSGISSGGYGNPVTNTGGGGGSLGRGGDATSVDGGTGTLGGGSSGSYEGYAVMANGADGIVIIEW